MRFRENQGLQRWQIPQGPGQVGTARVKGVGTYVEFTDSSRDKQFEPFIQFQRTLGRLEGKLTPATEYVKPPGGTILDGSYRGQKFLYGCGGRW